MDIYVVFRQGIVKNECGGLFSTIELAREAAHKLACREPDGYHEYFVIPYTIDTPTSCKDEMFHNDSGLDQPDPIMRLTKVLRKTGNRFESDPTSQRYEIPDWAKYDSPEHIEEKIY